MSRRLRIPFLALSLATVLGAAAAAAQVTPPPPEPRGWIGVSYETMPAQEGLRIRVVSQVIGVLEGSPAAGAGIRPGDILVSINGKSWEEHFGKGAPPLPLRPGDAVRMVVERDGRRREVRLVAGTRPVERVMAEEFKVTVMPDSIVEHLYHAMDSLRIRITEDEGLRERLAEIRVRADSVVYRVGSEAVVRMRRAEPARAVFITPFEPPPPPDSAFGFSVPKLPFPGGLKVIRAQADGSLTVLGEPAVALGWSAADVPEGTFVFRPTVPYVLGENRAAGAEVVELGPELAGYFGVEGGVLVVDVAPGTPAARAGILPGDVLTLFGGAPVVSIAEFRKGLAQAARETRVTLIRKGEPVELTLRR